MRRTAGLALVAWWLVPSQLWAQPAAPRCGQANAEIERALQLRERGRDDEGWQLLAALYARCPTPRVTAQLGVAEHALARWLDAAAHLDAALGAAHDAWVNARRGPLEALRRDVGGHLAELTLDCPLADAALTVDGVSRGLVRDHSPLRLTEGAHRIEVTAPGHRRALATLTLAGGERLVRRFDLAPEPPPAAPERDPTPAPATPPTARTAGRPQRAVGIAGLAVGAVVAGLGAYFWAETADAASAMRDAAPNTPGVYGAWARVSLTLNPDGARTYDEVCEAAALAQQPDARDAAAMCAAHDRRRLLAYALSIGGLALAGAGALLWALDRSPTEASPGARRRVRLFVPPRADLGLGLAGEF